MAYKYITEDNLYNKQTYMYSEYGGIDFLKEYVFSRQQYLDDHKDMKSISTEYEWEGDKSNDVICELLRIKQALKADTYNSTVMDLMNSYTKSFEVRKRVYEKYDNNWKPVGNKRFEDYEAYLLLAECLGLSYEHTKCLKYFSCMLKVVDTLLSIQDKLRDELKGILYLVIQKELAFFNQLMEQNGIILEEENDTKRFCIACR